MNNILHLKKWPEYRIYEITEAGLKIEFKDNGQYNQQVLKYENVGFDTQIIRYKPSPVAVGLFMSVFFNLLLGLIVLMDNVKSLSPSTLNSFGIGITVVLSIWAKQLFRFEKLKIIKGQVNVSFWYFKKEQQLVDDFIDALKQARANYFKAKYLKWEEDEDHVLIKGRLAWLKEEEIITAVEYKEFLTRLDSRKVIKGF